MLIERRLLPDSEKTDGNAADTWLGEGTVCERQKPSVLSFTGPRFYTNRGREKGDTVCVHKIKVRMRLSKGTKGAGERARKRRQDPDKIK